MKAKPCVVLANTAMGSVSPEVKFKSIKDGIEWANNSGYFAYRVFVDGKLVRWGFCKNR